MKVKHDFAPINILIETQKDLTDFLLILDEAISNHSRTWLGAHRDKDSFVEGVLKFRKDLIK